MKKLLIGLALVLAACTQAQPAKTEVAPGIETNTPAPFLTPFLPTPPTATAVPVPRLVGVVLGTDGRPDKPGYGIRTDTFVIVIADIPEDAPINLTLIAVPRDLFVPVPCEIGYPEGETPMNRVNAAWYRGDFECVADTIKGAFGLEVNAPIGLIDMADVTDLVDLMGGLVLTPEQDHFDECHGVEMFWAAGVPDRLDGRELLCYVRGRAAYGGDLDRGRRAVEIIKTAAQQWPAAILYDPARALDLFQRFYSGGLVSTWTRPASRSTLAQIGDLFALLPRVPEMKVRTVNMSVDDVNFARHPLYGSILLPLLDLPNWVTCVSDPTVNPVVCSGAWQLPP